MLSGTDNSPHSMQFIFGPVISRRLGRSLGIDLFSEKICNLNCIYCELGPTRRSICLPAEYTPVPAIVQEITEFFACPAHTQAIDVVTVTAKGEATLHSGLGSILRHIKSQTPKTVAVLTNGTTLMSPRVRSALMAADLVIPSLDAAREESFKKIDRPDPSLDLSGIIEGLITFSHEYQGRIWLEVLLSRGINDSEADLAALLPVVKRMRLDRVQLNTVIRPPAVPYALPLGTAQLASIARNISLHLGIPVDYPGDNPTGEEEEHVHQASPTTAATPGVEEEILRMIARRPCTAAEINRSFDLGGSDKVWQLLEQFVNAGNLQKREHAGGIYFQCTAPGKSTCQEFRPPC